MDQGYGKDHARDAALIFPSPRQASALRSRRSPRSDGAGGKDAHAIGTTAFLGGVATAGHAAVGVGGGQSAAVDDGVAAVTFRAIFHPGDGVAGRDACLGAGFLGVGGAAGLGVGEDAAAEGIVDVAAAVGPAVGESTAFEGAGGEEGGVRVDEGVCD